MTAFDIYQELQGALDGNIKLDEPMRRHTSWRIGGPAALYIECESLGDINLVIATVKAANLPWAVIGKGSNLLVADEGFDGAVLVLGSQFKRYSFPETDAGEGKANDDTDDTPASNAAANPTHQATSSLVCAGAGVALQNLVQEAFKRGLSGFEFAVGIPGTLGGALFMNAGSADTWIGSIVDTVTVLAPGVGLAQYRASDLKWAYRSAGIPASDIIVEATLRTAPGHTGQIRARMEGILARRKRVQPLSLPSAGSVFRNPSEGPTAGQLIDLCGFKGYQVGGAQVSEKHANFIVNAGNATARDVLDIIMHVRQRVKEDYGQQLQPEVRFLGFAAEEAAPQE
jgi:UDP-N-acetylmuramate dehydrogenase